MVSSQFKFSQAYPNSRCDSLCMAQVTVSQAMVTRRVNRGGIVDLSPRAQFGVATTRHCGGITRPT